VEDCRHLDQRSKLEEYGNHTFVVMHVFSANPADATDLHVSELHLFVRDGLVVTVHEQPLPVVDHVRARALKGEHNGCRSAGALLHDLLDGVVDELFPVVDNLNDVTELLSEKVLEHPEQDSLVKLLTIKRALAEIRRRTGPSREVLAALCRGSLPGVHPEDLLYFRNVLDHLFTLAATVDSTRDMVTDSRDLYLNAQAARVNNVVKRLSVIATLGLPLTFITGFFGMNFTHMPFDQDWLMAVAFSAMGLVPLVVFLGLRFKGWT
jgi:magnesium transporter